MGRYAVPVVTLIMSAFWFYKGAFEYGVWYQSGPGGGFMPVFASVLGMVFSVVLLFSKPRIETRLSFAAFIPLVMVCAGLTLSTAVGLLPALGVMLFVWLWKLEGYRFWRAAFITFWPMIVVYGIFRLWLNVPLPTGYLGT